MENTLKKTLSNINSMNSDKDIIDSILCGNINDYELIMRKYNQRMFRIARAILKDVDLAEDAVQEAYIKAYTHLKVFKFNSSFSTWLIRILINDSSAKKNYSCKMLYLDPASSENDSSDYLMNKNSPKMKTPEENTINNELRNNLEKLIDALPDKYRTVYMMREIEKMNTADTAKCLGISETNVKVRLNRSKEMLREKLLKVYENVEVFSFLGERCDRIVNSVMDALCLKSV